MPELCSTKMTSKMENNEIITINLEDYRARSSDGSIAKVFTGRDRGRTVREKSRLDILSDKNDKIRIVIPNNVYAINPSFFEELFLNVVQKLGKDRFLQKFEFVSVGEYSYEKALHEAITRILRTKTAIG